MECASQMIDIRNTEAALRFESLFIAAIRLVRL